MSESEAHAYAVAAAVVVVVSAAQRERRFLVEQVVDAREHGAVEIAEHAVEVVIQAQARVMQVGNLVDVRALHAGEAFDALVADLAVLVPAPVDQAVEATQRVTELHEVLPVRT